MKSKREALDREILKLTEQLRLSVEGNPAKKYEPTSLLDQDQHDPGSCVENRENVESSENNVANNQYQISSNDLGFHDSESDDELDCNIEEKFLKSSSLSGDDDVIDMTPSRPRSVHFEDEFKESGYFEVEENKSSSENSHSQLSWSAGSQRTLCQNEQRDCQENKADILLLNSRPINSRKSKESVREILRKRREMMDYTDHASRRRVRSLDERADTRIRSRSQSRDNAKQTRMCQREPTKGVESSVIRKSASMGNCSEGYLTQRQINFPLSAGSSSALRVNEIYCEGAVISKKEYAHFRSLVGSRKNAKQPNNRITKKPILKPNKSESFTKNKSR